MSEKHLPVMLAEVIESLKVKPDGIYIDATFGRGGHSRAILNQLNDNGRLICLDKDPEAIEYGLTHFKDRRVTFHQCCFSELVHVVEALQIKGKVNGVLFDLGVSSPQLDEAVRGFSFMREGPLDMRMNPQAGESAAAWINRADPKEISFVLKTYGEEKFAKKITQHIIKARASMPIESTKVLASIIENAIPFNKKGIHPATKTFQAIRIHVNQELHHLEKVLPTAMNILAPQGRVAMISFHSLEDRMVKRWFRNQSKVEVPKGIAIPEDQLKAPLDWVVKRLHASDAEIQLNARARSATLRVAEKHEYV